MSASPRDRPSAKQIVAALERLGAGGGLGARSRRGRVRVANTGTAATRQQSKQLQPPPASASLTESAGEPESVEGLGEREQLGLLNSLALANTCIIGSSCQRTECYLVLCMCHGRARPARDAASKVVGSKPAPSLLTGSDI